MYLIILCSIIFLFSVNTPLYAEGTFTGHVVMPKVKDNPNHGLKEMYEFYVFIFAEGEDVGDGCRSGACAGTLTQDGFFSFNLPAGKYSLIATEPRFFPRQKIMHDIIIQDGQTVTQNIVLNTDYSCFITEFGDVGNNTFYQTFIASGTAINRVAIKIAAGDSNPVPMTVTFHSGGIDGAQVGPARSVDAALYGETSFSYPSDEVKVSPGQTYAVKFQSPVSWAPFHAKADVYPNGQGYIGTSPYITVGTSTYSSDWQIYIGGDSDDTIVSYIYNKFGIGYLENMWSKSWGQTFKAQGVAIAGVDYFPTIGPNGFITSYVLIRENGPTGRIVAPKKTSVNPTDYVHGASWGPTESTLVPGNIYYVEIGYVTTTDPNPGFNIYLREWGHDYSFGSAYKDSVEIPGRDLNLTILEYITAPALETGTVAGTVQDTQTVASISGVTLSLSQSGLVKYTTTTGNNGSYSLNLTVGIYDVLASKSGYSSSSQTNVSITKNQTTTVNISLTPSQQTNPGTLSGSVKDAQSANPISGAAVQIKQSGQDKYVTSTDNNGTYTQSVDPGTYDITVVRSGYNSSTQNNITVAESQTVTVNFNLTTQQSQSDGLTIDAITSPLTQVAPGDTSKSVMMTVSNSGNTDLFIDNVGLTFTQSWTDVSTNFTITPKSTNPIIIPRNSSNVQFEFTVDVKSTVPTGATVVDGYIQGTRNLIPNGSFEENNTTPPTRWAEWTNNGGSYSLDTTSYDTGKQAYKLTFTNTSNGKFVTSGTGENNLLLPVLPLTSYGLSIRYKSGPGNVNRLLVWEEYDASRNKIGTDKNTYLANQSNWTSGGTTANTGATAAYVRVWVGMQSTADNVTASLWVDTLRLYTNTTVGDNTATTTLSWTVGTLGPDTIPPPVPTISSPTNDATLTTTRPTFYWVPVQDVNNQSPPVSYQIQVANDVTFNTPIIDQPVSATQFIAPNPLSSGVYYWRVRARDNYTTPNYSDYTTPAKITLSPVTTSDITPPPAPTLTAPSNGSTQTTARPNFSWTPVTDVNNQSNPVLYDIIVDNSPDFSTTPEIEQSYLTSPQFTPNSGLTNGVYYWRVRGCDSAPSPNCSASVTGTFTVNAPVGTDVTPPPVPNLIYPTNNLTTNNQSLTSDWSDVNDTQTPPVSYEVQVSTDIQFGVINHTATTSNSSSVISNLSSGIFYWHVRARDSATPPNYSNWSTRWTFVVNLSSRTDTTPPAALVDLFAEPGTVTGDVNLRWTAPGDDGNTGTLNGLYSIQYLTTNGPWNRNNAQITISAVNITPGTMQYYTVSRLDYTNYYFCLWTADENGTVSAESNKPAATPKVPSSDGTSSTKPEGKFVTDTVPAKFGTDAQEVSILDTSGNVTLDLVKPDTGGQIVWDGKDNKGTRLESGAYIYKIKDVNGNLSYGLIVVAK